MMFNAQEETNIIVLIRLCFIITMNVNT